MNPFEVHRHTSAVTQQTRCSDAPRSGEREPLGQTAAGAPRPLAEILGDVERLARRYVVLPEPAVVAVVLWIAHAPAIEAFDVTPYLAVTSPEKRCGKTRLLEVLEPLVPSAWRVVRPSEAVLFRRIERDCPTILLDEVDAIFKDKSEGSEGLRAVLNAGNRRGTVVSRCQGHNQALRNFPVFCPKVLAGIGALPDTVADRAIPVRLARRRKDERVERLRPRRFNREAGALRDELNAWAAGAVPALREMEPPELDQINDRASEAWEPLLAVADHAGGTWPERARQAALALHDEADDDTTGARLLRAIYDIFHVDPRRDRILTAGLLHALVQREGEPWGMWWGPQLDKDDTRGPGYKLAKLLRPFGVESKTLRVGDARGKGYERADFADAWLRYATPPEDDVTTGQRLPPNGLGVVGRGDATEAVTSSDGAETVAAQGLSPCHVELSGDGNQGRTAKEEPARQGRTDEPPNPYGAEPPRQCRVCREGMFHRAGEGWTCSTCHPPPPSPLPTGRL